MEEDTLKYDSLKPRPLPKWLTDQRDGLNTYQPEKIEFKEDNSLNIAFVSTGIATLLIVVFLTVFLLVRNKKRK